MPLPTNSTRASRFRSRFVHRAERLRRFRHLAEIPRHVGGLARRPLQSAQRRCQDRALRVEHVATRGALRTSPKTCRRTASTGPCPRCGRVVSRRASEQLAHRQTARCAAWRESAMMLCRMSIDEVVHRGGNVDEIGFASGANTQRTTVVRGRRARRGFAEMNQCHAICPRTACRLCAARPRTQGCGGRTCRRSGAGHAHRIPSARALVLPLWRCPDPTVEGGLRIRFPRCSHRAVSARRCRRLRSPRPPRRRTGPSCVQRLPRQTPASVHTC